MKIVINACFGGFSLPKEFCEKYHMDKYDDIERTDERLIAFVESHNNCIEENYARLITVEIPNNTTDWEISEYDGAEEIICVVDGKIHHF